MVIDFKFHSNEIKYSIIYKQPREMDKKILQYINTGNRSLGPAAYCVKPTIGKNATDPTIEKNPAYSMGIRSNHTSAVDKRTIFDTTGLTERGRYRTPGGVLGRRFGETAKAATPGPADYCAPPARLRTGVVIKPPLSGPADRWVGPGPNAYTLRDVPRGPWPLVAGRWPDRCVAHVSPGPGHYDATHPDVYLKGATRSGRTMAGRPADGRRKEATPGPSDYDGRVRPNCCARPRGVAEDGQRQPCRTSFGARWPEKAGVFAVRRDNEYGC